MISVEIMKTIDEREMKKNNKRKTNKDRKEQLSASFTIYYFSTL